MKRLFGLVLLLLVFVAAVMLVRAAMLKPAPLTSVTAAQPIAVDETAVIGRLAAAIRIPTVSNADATIDRATMTQFTDLLVASFPRVNQAMTREMMDSGSVLYTWKGKDPAADPVVLMGHMDVVPAEAATLSHWNHAPFSADIVDGELWGRGTLDDKYNVMAYLEAAEALLAQGFTPARTILLAFGDDEENGGAQGAGGIVKVLKARGVHAQFVVDEGGAVVHGVIAGMQQPVAVVGISEKGFLDVALSTTGKGGHSSEPPAHTAVGQLAAGLARLEAHPFPASLPAPVELQMTSVAPYLPFSKRLVLANLWLTRPLVVASGVKDPTLAGGYHTTTAETMFNGGVKDNVLPTEAHAVVNFRILPGETTDSVLAGVKDRVADGGIRIEKTGTFREPSPVSPVSGPGYETLVGTIRSMYTGVVVAPYLVQAATDSSKYYAVSDNVYRFGPFEGDPSVFGMAHGFNERIKVKSYVKAVQFEAELMRNIK